MCSILLVEDHPDTRHAFAVLLESWGHQITTRDSVAGGLAFVNANDVDVILSDIGLPDQNGYEFIAQVRRSNSRVIAIAISAYFTASDRRPRDEAGFDMYFSKPVDLAELRFTLARISAQFGWKAAGERERQDRIVPATEVELRHAI